MFTSGNVNKLTIQMVFSPLRVRALGRRTGVKLGQGVSVYGRPTVLVDSRARLILGDSVLLNSVDYGYHGRMHSAVKIIADAPGAVVRIGSGTRIHGACIHAERSVEIGENCLIAANSHILDSSGHPVSLETPADRLVRRDKAKPVVIENNVWIGLNALILPGVTVGEGSVVGAGMVVRSDVPPFTVLAG